jgi:hypothetical protein
MNVARMIWLALLVSSVASCAKPGSSSERGGAPVRARPATQSALGGRGGNPAEPAGYTLAELRRQNQSLGGWVRQADVKVVVSFFNHGSMRSMQHCYVLRDGELGMVRLTWRGDQGGGARAAQPVVQMPEALKDALNAAIARLPVDQSFAGDRDAFLVSWDDGGTWRTRVYDRTNLPRQVRELCDLVGVPATWL